METIQSNISSHLPSVRGRLVEAFPSAIPSARAIFTGYTNGMACASRQMIGVVITALQRWAFSHVVSVVSGEIYLHW